MLDPTPFPEHARNYMEAEPKHPPPVYAPEVVADAILFCAEHPRRDLIVGGGGKMTSAMDNVPRVADRYMRATMFDQQKRDEPPRAWHRDALYEPQPGGRERGDHPGRVMKRSVYTAASKHRVATLLGMAAVGAGLVIASRGRARADELI